MSNRLDVLKLIAEVEKRPILWDTQWVQHRVRGSLNIPWQEVAQTLGMKAWLTTGLIPCKTKECSHQ